METMSSALMSKCLAGLNCSSVTFAAVRRQPLDHGQWRVAVMRQDEPPQMTRSRTRRGSLAEERLGFIVLPIRHGVTAPASVML